MNGSFEREIYIGHEAQHMRGVLTLKRPIKNGIVQNWDEMEKVKTFLEHFTPNPCDLSGCHVS